MRIDRSFLSKIRSCLTKQTIKIKFDTIATLIDFERKSDFQSDNRLKSSKRIISEAIIALKLILIELFFKKKKFSSKNQNIFLIIKDNHDYCLDIFHWMAKPTEVKLYE